MRRLRWLGLLTIGCLVHGGLAVVSAQGTASNAGAARTPASSGQMPGFGVAYTPPAGWTLSGSDGRIHAWSNGDQTAAIVLYAGHFSPLQLALGDAQRVLGVPRDEDTKVISPLASTSFASHSGLAGSLRVTGERSVVAHVAVVQLNDSTVLGAVAVLEASVSDADLAEAVRTVAGVLSTATVREPAGDTDLTARLTGAWEVQQVYTSSPTGGGYTNEESWTFNADGTFAYRKRFSVSVPGGAVTPEERDDAGRWYAVGGALVLNSSEGRLTVDVQFSNGKLVLDGTTFNKR
jgi:hypothetical protein